MYCSSSKHEKQRPIDGFGLCTHLLVGMFVNRFLAGFSLFFPLPFFHNIRG